MTVTEIFSQIAQRMIEGLMTHSQLADYFGFLSLDGYQQCHMYHYFEENNNYKKISNYYLHHYNKIIMDSPFKNPNVIPKDQFQYDRYQVTKEVRKEAVIAGMERWVLQEKETKNFYENKYEELIRLNEVASAEELSKYIKDVDYELAEAERLYLELQAIDFNIENIIDQQDKVYKKYIKKIKEIELC